MKYTINIKFKDIYTKTHFVDFFTKKKIETDPDTPPVALLCVTLSLQNLRHKKKSQKANLKKCY